MLTALRPEVIKVIEMCGIFGIALRRDADVTRLGFEGLLEKLYLLSESRGKESAGLHLYLPQARQAWTIKGALPASELIQSSEFKELISAGLDLAYAGEGDTPTQAVIAIAHSRLVTNGRAEQQKNNQPVRWGNVTIIHNGIIVNVDDLWTEKSDLQRHAEVDTEILAAILSDEMGFNRDPLAATRKTFAAIQGAASVAWVHSYSEHLVLATNTGDLYLSSLAQEAGVLFASERYILEGALSACESAGKPSNLNPGHGYFISLGTTNLPRVFSLSADVEELAVFGPELPGNIEQHDTCMEVPSPPAVVLRDADESLLRYNEAAVRALKRCTCCVLPETFPFIEFDEQGVCNYCRGYQPKYKGLDPELAKKNFLESISKYRSRDGSPDVLVPFSGGRDSCYGLHLIKQEFGLNPITFTYDWGMVTDLARRNIARFCGKLGVQNILVSADIKTKRDNIRKNVSAWLRKPDLGMVPLFMAGDKHFFRIVNDLKRQTGIRLDLWSANPLENTDFKSGFCGVAPDFEKHRVDYLSFGRKLKMAFYYASRFAGNPGYINSSLLDTAQAFLSYYVEPREDFFFMFTDLVWNEDLVNETIIGQYNFELSPDSPSSWRIGDGTAPFYNYIYMTARGFSEFDTFRSNQIREGMITRDKALEAIAVENRPRVESLRWYLETIGLDFNDTVRRINELDRSGFHK